ncbi:restriction endonuclease subunit S [Salicola sp. Rm-C-2C1-2]|uniref:restriction endonuclease subunit S n=1 Tax=Salicola sp. Rm-C-2C1-2 TaxID=3141321 RepID=UPI0032E3FBE8
MSYSSYPGYKDSDVNWLGDIPTDWFTAKLKRAANLITGVTPPSDDLDNYSEDGWPWVTPDDLDEAGKPITASKYVTQQGWGYCRPVKPGATLVCCIGSIGKVGFSNRVISTNQQITALEPACHPRFLFYCMNAAKPELDQEATGNVLRILNAERLGNLSLALPSSKEQTQIARFLDHQTARIDALIAEQQRLIELLKEKRQAAISHAVTKGLDPDVVMKDSGVEWVGEVPEHWNVPAIKRLSVVQRGASPRPIDDPVYFEEEGEYGWVRIADVSASSGYLESTTQTLSALGSSLSVKLEPGALFVSIAGTVGKPCITNIKACIHDGFVYFPELAINSKFLYYIFESELCYKGLGKLGTQLNLNTETIGGIKIGLPPDSEIEDIVGYLEKRLSQIDEMSDQARATVELMEERRSALISAAVTGKIDVRDWEPPVSETFPQSTASEEAPA